ncbi:MAG TPA: right-handed parallel beta-helix repeat-containing protein [Thermoanaerobaculia bacterium]|nr:right-handed parallel beta-helix repeat-containing protein [Thermoanaerobaculia bacterium]
MKRIWLAALTLTITTTAFGQATRTWVSGVGDDANPCSRTAPCKTFAGAISKTAAGGEISVLDPGGFGALTITKGITLDGTGTLGSILNSGTNGIVVNAAVTDNVILRNIQIDGAGTGTNGIRVLQAKSVRLEDVTIFGQSQRGIDIQPNSFVNVALIRTRIHNSGGIGVVAQGGATPGVVKLSIIDSAIDGGGSHGLWVTNGNTATVQNSLFAHNTLAGVIADGSNTRVTISHSNFSQNLNGIQAGNGVSTNATIWIFDSEISGNNTGVMISQGIAQSHGNNAIRGNTTDVAGGTLGTAGLQ